MSDGSANYDIHINLKKVGDGWEDMSAGIGRFSDAVDGAVLKLGRLGLLAIGGAVVGGIAALTYGVAGLNKEAEGAAISIGTIFSVNGIASSVPAGITMAQDTIAKMRVDAQQLPGEFKDLQQIFTMGAIPMFQAGASVDQARKLSAQVMAAGAVMQIPMDMVARENAMLLAGRAGAHNKFGTMLGFSGDKAHELNAADPAKRLQLISAQTQKYAGAIDIFAHSYDGLSSTLVDNVKNFGRLATTPLFESVKTTLSNINNWFSVNQDQVTRFAMRLGSGIQEAFEWGKAKILEWYPIVERFVDTAYNRFRDFWAEIKPSVSSFAQSFKDALSDPNGTIDKLKTLFEMYAALKIGSGLLGAGNGLYDLSKGIGGMLSGGKAGAALGAVGGVTRGVGAAYGEIELGGAAAGSGLAGLGGSAAVVGGVFLAAIAAWGAAAYEASELWSEVHSQTLADTQAIATAHGAEISSMLRAGESQEQIATTMQDHAADYVDSMDTTGWAMNDVASSAAFAAAGLNDLGLTLGHAAGQRASDDIADRANRDSGMVNFMAVMGKALPNAKTDAENAAKKVPKVKGGHGGTSIQKVEIVVTSNQSPSRIARAVDAKLANTANNRRVSSFVKNWSALDGVD